jgi:histidine triad (HIT) family protein
MSDCIFCKIVAGEAQSWKVYENDSVYAFLDIHPVSEYHTLIIPKKHYENIFDIPEKELTDVMLVVKKLAGLYHTQLGINHLQIINSSGAEAQQHVFHIHFHIVPRQRGDGQDVKWTTHPEWTTKYDQLLARIKPA